MILCGGSKDMSGDDGLDGFSAVNAKKTSTSSALDKYTMQEKILPLIRAIKTKEPAVMLAALKVLQQVGSIADIEFIAMDILPVLWNMSLGPLLDLKQFQSFMDLIKSLSIRVENEHTKKLQELSGSMKPPNQNDDFMAFGAVSGFEASNGSGTDNPEDDFERLVQGKVSNGGTSNNSMDAGWDAVPNAPSQPSSKPTAATFAWSTPNTSVQGNNTTSGLRPQQAPSRTITPDLSRFDALTPTATQFSQPLQPQPVSSQMTNLPLQQRNQGAPQSSINWSMPASNAWASPPASNPPHSAMSTMTSSFSNMSSSQRPATNTLSSFSLPPPPISPNNNSAFQIPNQQNTQPNFGFPMNQQAPLQPKKSGLDAYESLL